MSNEARVSAGSNKKSDDELVQGNAGTVMDTSNHQDLVVCSSNYTTLSFYLLLYSYNSIEDLCACTVKII